MALFTVPEANAPTPMTGGGIFGVPTQQPATVAPPKPLFGGAAETGPVQFGVGSGLDAYGASPLGMYMQQKQQEMLAAAGLTGVPWAEFDEQNPLNDPDVQRQANETQLAKIATANPELAAELAARMQGGGEDQSVWENIKDLGGDILAPVVSLGAKALDLLSRPARLVPELITDDENDTFFENVGQVLGGNSTASWSEVIREEMDIDNKFVQAVGGFVGDVLTDPLTYAGFGLLGLGRRTAQGTAGKLVTEGMLRGGLKEGATEAQEKAIAELTHRLTNVAKISPEASAAELAKHLNDIPGISQELRDQAVRMGHETAQVIGRGLGSRALPASARDILQQVAAKRSGMEARAAAGALGGVRMRAGVPFTQYRYTSGALPFTEGRKFVGVGGNFFRGTSGMTRLQNYLNKNPQINGRTREAMYKVWVEKGWKGFEGAFPKEAKELGNGALNFGSMFVSASSRMGRVTSSLSPRTNTYRHGGLVGIAAANASRSALALKSKINESFYELHAEVDDITGEALPAMNRHDFEKNIGELLDDPEVYPAALDYMQAVPHPSLLKLSDDDIVAKLTDEANRVRLNKEMSIEANLEMGLQDEAWAIKERAAADARLAAAAEEAKSALKNMRNVEKNLNPRQKELVHLYQRAVRQGMEMGDQHGNRVGDRSTSLIFSDVINPNDVPRYIKTSHPLMQTADTHATFAGSGPRVSDAKASRFGAHGLEFTADAAEEGATRVAVRTENPLVVRAGDTLSDEPLLKAWESDLRAMFDKEGVRKALQAENKLLEGDAEYAEFVNEEVQRYLSRKAVDAGYDSIVHVKRVKNADTGILEDKVEGGVLLVDPDMKRGIGMAAISDDVGQAYGGRGYVPIQATEAMLRAKHGERFTKDKDIYIGEFVHEKERLTNESIFDMNKRLKEKYNLGDEDAVNMDLGSMFNLYAARTATGAAQRQLGVGAESLHALYGRAAPEMVTNLNRYAGKGFLDHGAVNKLSYAAAKKYDDVTKAAEKEVARQEKILNDNAQEVLRLRAIASGEGLTRAAVGVRGVGKARVVEGMDLGKATKQSMQRISKLKSQIKTAKKGERLQGLEEALRTEQARLRMIQAEAKKAKTGKIVPSTPDKVVKAVDKQAAGLEGEVERISKLSVKQQKQLERAEMAVEKAAKELESLRTRLETHMAKATPAFTDDATMAGYTRITGVPELEGMFAHPYIAEEFANALKGKGFSAARKEWRRFQGVWKSWATVYYPGFHVRNNIGAWFNNWLGGVGSGHYAYSHRISNALNGGKYADEKVGMELGNRFGIDPQTTWRQLGEHFHSMGVRSSNSMALADQAESVGALIRMQGGKRSKLEKASARVGRTGYAKLARKTTEVTENFHRQAAMLRGLEVTGGDYAGARAFTMMRHGDYEDLNDFEHFIKDIIPFYKWMRMNLPFQIHQLLEAPGKQLAVLKAGDAAITAAGEDPNNINNKLPDFTKEAFNIALPRGVDGDQALQLISLDLPMSDLFSGGTDFLSSAVPLVMPFIEAYAIKHDIFKDAPIEGKMKPLAGWMQLPGIEQLLSPMTKKDAAGNLVMDDRTQKVLNIIPLFSRFRNWAFADEASSQRRVGALMSTFMGIRPEDFNQDDLLAYEKRFFYDNIEPEIAHMRNLGVSLPEPNMVHPSVFAQLGLIPPVKEG